MVFSDAVTTTTRNFIVPTAFDTITKGSPFLQYILQNAKQWKSGVSYDFPIKYQDTTNGGNTGIADKLDTDRQNVRTMLSFQPKMSYKPVVVSNIETTLNSGDLQVLDLLETEFNSQAQSLAMVMSQNLFNGNGTGNSWDSLAEAADDGTNFPTYGGKTKSAYPTIKGYYLASAGTTSLAKLATAYDACTVGMSVPNKIITTKSIWSTYESLLTPNVRANYLTNGYPQLNSYGMIVGNNGTSGAKGGFDILYFRGAPVIRDEQVASGKIFFTNDDNFFFAGISIKADNIKQLNFKPANATGVSSGVVGNVPMTLGFNFRDLMSPVDQLAEVGHLIYAGNFISTNPRLNGQLDGAN